MALPTNKIKKITIPNGENTTTYDIVPEMLQDGSTSYKATLATLTADSTIALTTNFSASATGTSTTEAKYITINGVEWKLAGGNVDDVQINGSSILSSGVANIVTNSTYNASSNKIATMDDLPNVYRFI